MPFGKHKGKEMQDVPASYLLHLYHENKTNFTSQSHMMPPPSKQVMIYIEDNLQALEQEMKKR